MTPFNSKNRPPKTAKKIADFRTPKKAFDEVMDAYDCLEQTSGMLDTMTSRQASRVKIAAERDMAIDFYSELPKGKKGKGGLARGTAVRNPTTPTMLDFKCDVDAQVSKIIHNPSHMVKFIHRYVFGEECLTRDEQHVFARYEQQLGRLFCRFHIWPVSKYFISVREKR